MYVAVSIMVNIPIVQSYMGARVASALSHKLCTKVSVGRVSLGFFNRVIVDDVDIRDQKGLPMLRVARASAKPDVMALVRGQLYFNSVQLFGLKANFYQATATAKPNYQFALDSLASKDTTAHRPLDVSLKSLIIRRGEICYNRLDKPRRPFLDPYHLNVQNLSSHIVLNALRSDSLNLNVKRLSLTEASGLDIRSLAFKLVGNKRHATMRSLCLELPSSKLSLADVEARYAFKDGMPSLPSLRFSGSVCESVVALPDIAALWPKVGKRNLSVALRTQFAGSATALRVRDMVVSVPQKGMRRQTGAPADIRLSMDGTVSELDGTPQWWADIENLTISERGLRLLGGSVPAPIARMNNIQFRGLARAHGQFASVKGTLLSGVGNANLDVSLRGNDFAGHLDTRGINLRQILDDYRFGILAANIHVAGNVKRKYYKANGTVKQIDYNDYSYCDARMDGSYDNGLLNGTLHVNDPNLVADLNGSLSASSRNMSAHLTADVKHIHPAALHLWESVFGNATYSGNVVASFTGNDLNTAKGTLSLTHFSQSSASEQYTLDSLKLQAGNDHRGHYLTLESDFAEAEVTGRFDYATLIQSVKNAIAAKLPNIQQLTNIKYKKTRANDFALRAIVRRADWLRHFFDVPVTLMEPLRLTAAMTNADNNLELRAFAPRLVYDGIRYRDLSAIVTSPHNYLNADISAVRIGDDGTGTEYRLEASAVDDRLASVIHVDNHAHQNRLRGRLNTLVSFGRDGHGLAEARMDIKPSTFSIGDSVFEVRPSQVIYGKNRLDVRRFALEGNGQRIVVNGCASKDSKDSLVVDMHDVNVSYLMDLLDFHPVEFGGRATGKALLSRLFDKPRVGGKLEIADFSFERGALGTLHADVAWNEDRERIDIDAVAVDTANALVAPSRYRYTFVKGYVSPKRNYIDLDIRADNMRGDFVESFCASFMNRTNLSLNGGVRLWGDLGELNLTGNLVANGQVGIEPLNTVYTLRDAEVRCLINEMQFPGDTIYDRHGNKGVLAGSLYHDHITNLRYNLRAKLSNLLAYDWGPSHGNTFYGTVYGTGNVDIRGKSGLLDVDVNVTPNRGTTVVYDASSPEAISSQEFIKWSSRDSVAATAPVLNTLLARMDSIGQMRDLANEEDAPTDIHVNFIINATPAATLKVVMDRKTGDCVNLVGEGALRADYYNKGAVNIFGNYVIDEGVYKLTIQNIIKRDFKFAHGGSIVFGGDPGRAALNLKAQYTLNSVSLSDLQIGRSFSGNNIRVNCIMNITGTPEAPKVEFDLDLPTVGTDAKQMIYSLINSEEELNQQVLYLLAVGRFYSQPSNNAATSDAPDSQTTLAMQSIISGQISQQINTVLNSVVKNNNWNFGANISTGDEGWNNAEYEGLLSGRMLNNRLIFNGEFGYRDNKNTTTSFIGDFDLRYLIFPNGNLSIHVYNQSNDRYFVRNSLNTQGVGIILKKDFDSWRSLLGIRKKNEAVVDDGGKK